MREPALNSLPLGDSGLAWREKERVPRIQTETERVYDPEPVRVA